MIRILISSVQGNPRIYMDISIAIPAHNEAARIERCVSAVMDLMGRSGREFEVIISECGSDDGTAGIADSLSKRHPEIKHIRSDLKLGKGWALKEAFACSSGGIFIYMDADLATDLSHIRELVSAINDGYDVAIGSRRLPGSKVDRPVGRRALSFFYNSMARILFRDGIRDHQCGFKAFSRDSVSGVIDESVDDGFFWDTELLV